MIRSFIPAIVWALIILVISGMPGRFFPSFSVWDLLTADKIGHMVFYGIFCALILRGFQKSQAVLTVTMVLASILMSTFYGILMEWMQYAFFPDRLYEVMDMIANGIGAVSGWIIYRFSVQKMGFLKK